MCTGVLWCVHIAGNYCENIFTMWESSHERHLMMLYDSTSVQSCPVGDIWFTSDAHEHGGTYILLNIK